MIPLRDQEALRQRFQEELTSRVRIDYFAQRPSRLYVPGRQECAYCEEVRTLLEELASLSDRIALTVHEFGEQRQLAASLGVDKVPGIVVRGQANRAVRFFGVPGGNEFTGFIGLLTEAARGEAQLAPETLKQLRKVKTDVHVQVFVTPTCPYCPALARTALRFGIANAKIRADVVEVSEFPQLAQRYGVRGVPMTVIDGIAVVAGAMTEAQLLQRVLQVVEGKPLSASDARGGSVTALQTQPVQAARQRLPGSGLILPR